MEASTKGRNHEILNSLENGKTREHSREENRNGKSVEERLRVVQLSKSNQLPRILTLKGIITARGRILRKRACKGRDIGQSTGREVGRKGHIRLKGSKGSSGGQRKQGRLQTNHDCSTKKAETMKIAHDASVYRIEGKDQWGVKDGTREGDSAFACAKYN